MASQDGGDGAGAGHGGVVESQQTISQLVTSPSRMFAAEIDDRFFHLYCGT
jgi:hypothetical protein